MPVAVAAEPPAGPPSLKDIKKATKRALKGVEIDADGRKVQVGGRDFKSTLARLTQLEDKVRKDTSGILLERPQFEADEVTKSQMLRDQYVFRVQIECGQFWQRQAVREQQNAKFG
jgi:hypothetical protein